jgi:hypothetical protein
MTSKNLIHDYLITHGWKYTGSCNCNGKPTYKYTAETNNGQYRLKVSAKTYLLSKPNEKYFRNTNNELKETVDEIYKEHIKAQAKI